MGIDRVCGVMMRAMTAPSYCITLPAAGNLAFHAIISAMLTSHTPSSPLRRRIQRGLEGLFGPFEQIDERPARELLSPEALALFQRMSAIDRAHSLRVHQWLVDRGYDQEELLTAALLHDCGKAAAPISVWQRTLKVLLKRFAPGWWKELAAPAPPDSWRYPFHVLHAHPRIGAAWAREAGCSELTCWLIEQHETPPSSIHPHADLLWALEFADATS
ncbi:MAG TPA: HD domain-containing protein [Caldilineales bacterium]|nr:HD domain-containing protein [Caldilineales bacterium]